MPKIPGLFLRGSTFYLRIVLPINHPLRLQYPSGRIVHALGVLGRKEASTKALLKRANVLGTLKPNAEAAATPTPIVAALPSPSVNAPALKLRHVFRRWCQVKHRPADSIAACERAVKLFEAQTGDLDIRRLTRAQGDEFRAWLLKQGTATKTARDRFTWVKSLLKYAQQDLGLITISPWAGLDIDATTTVKRRPWSDAELTALFRHEIWQGGTMPTHGKAGGLAAYWIPLLALYTGARCSELCQLTVADVVLDTAQPYLRVTDQGEGQQVKTAAAHRSIPIHSELVRLGFLDYVRAQDGPPLWPLLLHRKGKPGGYFSAFFTELRQSLGLDRQVVFHSFRHTVRTRLAAAGVPEATMDRLLGHQASGSVGTRVYTHVSAEALKTAVETLRYATVAPLPWWNLPEPDI